MDNETLIATTAAWFQCFGDLMGPRRQPVSVHDALGHQLCVAGLKDELRSTTEALAVEAGRRGIDATAYWDLVGNLEAQLPATWDAAWALTKQLNVTASSEIASEDVADAATDDKLEQSLNAKPDKRRKRGRKPDPEVAKRRKAVKALEEEYPGAPLAKLVALYNVEHPGDEIDEQTVRNDLRAANQ